MAEDIYSSSPTNAASGRVRTLLVIAMAAFLLGIAVAAVVIWRTDFDFGTPAGEEAAPAALAAAQPSPSPVSIDIESADRAAQALDRVSEQQGGIDQRVAAMEQRLARLDLQAQAAAGNAARAEGLLIAFATRRALERGAPLGYLADQLNLRFGDARPNAVKTVIQAAEDPITLDQLLARLEGLAPRLARNPKDENALQSFKRELSALFIVRRESLPSPQPERRLERARLFLESGRIDIAVAEVRHLPNAAEAQAWIEDAERYSRAQRALDLIETTAILEPRQLRDGAGNRVEQMSPAAGR
ncbi:MAG TPA: hypothetical protein VL100_08585 [Croceibacterium sp.]|nr:hypothetical protein [Croceibacterium sp.]